MKGKTKPETAAEPLQVVAADNELFLETQHSDKIREFGQRIMVAMMFEGDLYLQLCRYIRQYKVGPKIVRRELQALGFDKTRISKLIAVAHSPDDIWSEWMARAIGFNKALQLTRESAKLLVEKCGDALAQVGVDSAAVYEMGRGMDIGREEGQEGQGKGQEGQGKGGREEGVSEAESAIRRLGEAVDKVLRVAREALVLGVLRSKTYAIADGFSVSIVVKRKQKKGSKI